MKGSSINPTSQRQERKLETSPLVFFKRQTLSEEKARWVHQFISKYLLLPKCLLWINGLMLYVCWDFWVRSSTISCLGLLVLPFAVRTEFPMFYKSVFKKMLKEVGIVHFKLFCLKDRIIFCDQWSLSGWNLCHLYNTQLYESFLDLIICGLRSFANVWSAWSSSDVSLSSSMGWEVSMFEANILTWWYEL